MGWKLDPGKSVSGVTSTTVLGVVVTLLDGALQFHIDEAHLRKWCYDIDAALDSGRLSPSCASKLVGKLGWGTQQAAALSKPFFGMLDTDRLPRAGFRQISAGFPGRITHARQWVICGRGRAACTRAHGHMRAGGAPQSRRSCEDHCYGSGNILVMCRAGLCR